MNNFSVVTPLNNLSFGNVSIALLRELYNRQISPSLFPIGSVDISAQKSDTQFNTYLQSCINKALVSYSRKDTSVRLWHIGGSHESISSNDSRLITFFELDSLSDTEINILNNHDKVYVTSNFTKQVFKDHGVESTYLPLGFDSHNFYPLKNRPKIDGVIQWGMFGKWEDCRKSHGQMLGAWVKKYGNKREHRLNLSVTNPFLKPEDLNTLISRALDGKAYWNLNFLPFQPTNEAYNSVIQACDIALCVSGGEGRDLPCYHATALGAWPVSMRAHAYLDYLNDDNAILISPNGKKIANDGIFFHHNKTPFNNGNFFTFSDDDFLSACEIAEKKVKMIGLNVEGLKLQNLTYSKTVDILLDSVK